MHEVDRMQSGICVPGSIVTKNPGARMIQEGANNNIKSSNTKTTAKFKTWNCHFFMKKMMNLIWFHS